MPATATTTLVRGRGGTPPLRAPRASVPSVEVPVIQVTFAGAALASVAGVMCVEATSVPVPSVEVSGRCSRAMRSRSA
jgi:hypothetical protein